MIYILFANGFEEIEAVTVTDILRRAELKVTTVGSGARHITGGHGIGVICDITDSEFDYSDATAVILPGGMPGTLNIEKNTKFTDAVKFCAEHKKLICAICAAPSILGHMGLLRDVKAVCYPGFESQLIGATVLEDSVSVDGNIITSRGAGTAISFALTIVAKILGAGRADALRRALIYETEQERL